MNADSTFGYFFVISVCLFKNLYFIIRKNKEFNPQKKLSFTNSKKEKKMQFWIKFKTLLITTFFNMCGITLNSKFYNISYIACFKGTRIYVKKKKKRSFTLIAD